MIGFLNQSKAISTAISKLIGGVNKRMSKFFRSGDLDGKPLPHWTSDSFQKMTDKKNKIRIKPKEGNHFWKEHLSMREYHVLRKKGTEAPNTSILNHHFPKHGYYGCRGCGNPLYSHKAKFDSGCGWPAFGSFVEDSIHTRDDYSFGVKRTEIMCAKCASHLGHVFPESHGIRHNERHCVNGIALKYIDSPLPTGCNAKKTVFSKK